MFIEILKWVFPTLILTGLSMTGIFILAKSQRDFKNYAWKVAFKIGRISFLACGIITMLVFITFKIYS